MFIPTATENRIKQVLEAVLMAQLGEHNAVFSSQIAEFRAQIDEFRTQIADAVRDKEIAERKAQDAERKAQDADRKAQDAERKLGTGNFQSVCGFPVALCKNEHTLLGCFQTLN